MAMFILMAALEADQVRGASISGAAASLEPVERQGGFFILGAEVLTDPAHEAHWAFLGGCPQMDGEDPGFPPAIAG